MDLKPSPRSSKQSAGQVSSSGKQLHSIVQKTGHSTSGPSVPSRVVSRRLSSADPNSEEIEIAAQVIVPEEGGWGWVVVAAAFMNIFVVDGVLFTFGSLFIPITEDLQVEQSLVGFINSLAVTLYFSCGPIASAMINRFGFRAVSMTGAVICFVSLVCTYSSTNYAAICLFYGGFAGLGYCFINMCSSLVVGFYFERLRSLALAIANSGSSAGMMVMFPLNSYLVELSDWRSVTLLHAGLMGVIYFMSMTFKPLLSLTVTKATDDATRTVTYLPSVSRHAVKPALSKMKSGVLAATAAENIFGAVSNYNFPTAADVVADSIKMDDTNQAAVAGPSTISHSKLKLTAVAPKSGMSQRHLKQVHSIMSKTGVQDKAEISIESIVIPKKKRSCWARLCQWEEHIPQSRPMYKDDVFYDGKLKSLPVYQKSKMDTSDEQKTGLEYQLTVSRAAATTDLQEKKGLCTTAARRVLATMMDPSLLKRFSYLLLNMSCSLAYLGVLVPYIFIKIRNLEAGVDEVHCNWFVSVMGFFNLIGRIGFGALADRVNPFVLFTLSFFMSGFSTAFLNFSFNIYYQYLCCSIFGFFVGNINGLRSMVLVQLYGLDKLTNATGMIVLFQGLACCISTPAATIVKDLLGYSYTFYIAGALMCVSGVFVLPVPFLSTKEQKNSELNDYQN